MLIVACSSPPPANPPETQVEARAETGMPAIAEAHPSSGCDGFAFENCSSACSTRSCLDWCAGTQCVELAGALYECAIPGERDYLAAHPEPELVSLPPGPDADPDMPAYEMIDPESEERYYEWEMARDDAMRVHWESACVPRCEDGLDSEGASEPAQVCGELQLAAYRWGRYAPPKPEPADPKDELRLARHASAGILGVMSVDMGSFGPMGVGMFGGSSMRMDMEAAGDFEHRYALGQLIRSEAKLDGLDACIPGMSDDSKPEVFKVALTFDVHGGIDRAIPTDDSPEGQCVAERLAQTLRLPEPALRGLPIIRVDVTVAAEREVENMWGGLIGNEVGEAYGVGGLGLVGTGEGGGGTGEGTIGVGTIGSGGGGSASGYGSSGGSTASTPSPDEAKKEEKD